MANGPLIDMYCDESSDHAGPRYMIFGGLVVPISGRDQIVERISKWRRDEKMNREMKWTKVSRQRCAEYTSYINLFCELSAKDLLHFKSLVLDKNKIDYKKFCEGNRVRGRYKFFYSLLLHKFGPYATSEDHRLRVFFDDTTRRDNLEEFRKILNAGICKKFRRVGEVVRTVEPINSKRSEMVQMADVLMGAVGFHWNEGESKANACEAKIGVAKHLADCFKLESLKIETARGTERFNIWPLRLQ